ncbi:MAG TPA: nucleotidyltransferase domain-containing protein [Candidatus Dormibacteraeota bacterium]|nr:nucleotidyltransferase domain-containing protein [Candidatus Dormibacteraeota bacterium]
MTSDGNIVRHGLILRGTVGSTAHGLHLGGTDDRDEMGVAIEPPSRLIGLVPFEHYVYRTAEERTSHDTTADQRRRGRTPRSMPGDLDLVVYSLRKYTRLAANGNPTVQILLFVEPLHSTRWGDRLRAEADMFASREAGARFLGYLRAQRERLLGQRGQMRVTRTELIEAHGYDTKFAMHALRLG